MYKFGVGHNKGFILIESRKQTKRAVTIHVSKTHVRVFQMSVFASTRMISRTLINRFPLIIHLNLLYSKCTSIQYRQGFGPAQLYTLLIMYESIIFIHCVTLVAPVTGAVLGTSGLRLPRGFGSVPRYYATPSGAPM